MSLCHVVENQRNLVWRYSSIQDLAKGQTDIGYNNSIHDTFVAENQNKQNIKILKQMAIDYHIALVPSSNQSCAISIVCLQLVKN